MSQENIEIVRSAFEALTCGKKRRQKAFAREYLHPEFKLNAPYSDWTYHGLEGTRKYLSDFRDTWGGYAYDLQELIDLEERVVAVMQMSPRQRGSQVPVVQEIAALVTFAGKRVIHVQGFVSRAAAFEAVGLAE